MYNFLFNGSRILLVIALVGFFLALTLTKIPAEIYKNWSYKFGAIGIVSLILASISSIIIFFNTDTQQYKEPEYDIEKAAIYYEATLQKSYNDESKLVHKTCFEHEEWIYYTPENGDKYMESFKNETFVTEYTVKNGNLVDTVTVTGTGSPKDYEITGRLVAVGDET